MFAYAIWDARKRLLLLARDRFGKKPLYYAALPEGLYFGSELKCLREAGVPLEIDPEALRLYFSVQLHSGPLERLPGHPQTAARLVADLPRRRQRDQGRYWSSPAG